jgi:transcriptional regulator with XRE-family HTH domain
MDTLTGAIAAAVRDDMRQRGISELKLSELSGIPRVTLRRRLAGTSPFTTTELAHISEALGRPVSGYFAAAEGAA